MKFKKLYLDMDGVLTDFEMKFAQRFGFPSMTVRDRKNFSTEWPTFVEEKLFEELEWHEGGQELLAFIRQYPIEVEILSSSGGPRFHEEVKAQKKVWLKAHGIDYKVNVVPGRVKKKEYATPDRILIDDTLEIITQFNDAGGVGIHHKDLGKTLKTLKVLLEMH